MSMEVILAEVNRLYKKSQEEGLTEAEKVEQKRLREEYLKIFRANFRAQISKVELKK